MIILPSFLSIVSGDLSGERFPKPVRTLVEETIPPVSEPPGKSAGFQARAGLPIALKRREAGFQRSSTSAIV
jgi:hypothetical protein